MYVDDGGVVGVELFLGLVEEEEDVVGFDGEVECELDECDDELGDGLEDEREEDDEEEPEVEAGGELVEEVALAGGVLEGVEEVVGVGVEVVLDGDAVCELELVGVVLDVDLLVVLLVLG